jgi:hypothetical protein
MRAESAVEPTSMTAHVGYIEAGWRLVPSLQ